MGQIWLENLFFKRDGAECAVCWHYSGFLREGRDPLHFPSHPLSQGASSKRLPRASTPADSRSSQAWVIMAHLGKGWRPSTFQKGGGAVGASQGFSLPISPPPSNPLPCREIPGRNQLVKSWFPAFPSQAAAKPAQAPPSRSRPPPPLSASGRDPELVFEVNPEGGTWLFPQVSAGIT